MPIGMKVVLCPTCDGEGEIMAQERDTGELDMLLFGQGLNPLKLLAVSKRIFRRVKDNGGGPLCCLYGDGKWRANLREGDKLTISDAFDDPEEALYDLDTKLSG